MSAFLPPSPNLQPAVQQLLALGSDDLGAKAPDPAVIQHSLQKVIAPTFEIVFAGAFSAGKSMLINSLLGRKLLYSAEGHATGTECRVAYAELEQERVVLTFQSQATIHDQALELAVILGISLPSDWDEGSLQAGIQSCQGIIQQEGGPSKSERAKQAVALEALLVGYWGNRDRIHPTQPATYSMEQFQFSTFQEASNYARRGSNSAVLRRIDYYCHHELLRDGNVLVDTPGIDAPVKRDAELTYQKIADPETSAVICVLKVAETGELTTEETALLETIRANPSIRDRVFYVFNRVDKAWYNVDLRQRLDDLIQRQFRDTNRVYKTSGLLGFYGSQILGTSLSDRFGLDSLFAQERGNPTQPEDSPLFVTEFNNYCGSGKLIGTVFRPEIRGYERPNENYVRILSDYGAPLIEHLIKDSGIEEFRAAIRHYLTTEKRPQLFANLADDLQLLCISLRRHYIEQWLQLEGQPQTIAAIQQQELRQLSQDLQQIGLDFKIYLESELNQVVASGENQPFEEDFRLLQAQMVKRLDTLLKDFSVAEVHQRAQASHKRNAVVPLLGILAEGFYFLANGLEETLVDCSEGMVRNFFEQLLTSIQSQDYYRNLYRLLGNDSGLEERLLQLSEQVVHVIRHAAQLECDRYVRERPEFYAESTVSIFQLRQTLQQSCRGLDHRAMVDAEPAIRQLLKLDFEQKVGETVMRTFRVVLNSTLNTHLLAEAEQFGAHVWQQYDHARVYLAKTLEREASEKIKATQNQQALLRQSVTTYNEAIAEVNNCLETMQLDRQKLPAIADSDLVLIPAQQTTEWNGQLESLSAENHYSDGILGEPTPEIDSAMIESVGKTNFSPVTF
jgi:replication fork clamp-binding protein CrfC